jgi:nicotinate phosphoribosyltransferase
MRGDTVTLVDDPRPGEPLLAPFMRDGRRLDAPEPLDRIRRRAADQLARLPVHLQELDVAPVYPVRIAASLEELAAELDAVV